MSLYSSSILFLKRSTLALMVSATVFLAGTAMPGVDAMAETQKSAAAATNTNTDASSLLTNEQLDELVGPIALYPDELIAIVLPASTYPLEIVQASRYLEKHKNDSKLKPDENWDSSVLGLLNYPEVIDKMNTDLSWTWKLGEAVANQQSDVMDAIQQFRNEAHTAGNLESGDKQIIIVEKEIIKIESASPEVIYVPSYNPQTVVVYSPTPYPYYYSAPYPYYYNPAAVFWTGMFVGAAISYGVGWGHYGSGHNDININRNTNISGGNRTVNRGGNTWSPNRGGGQVGRPGGGTRPGAGTRPSTRPGSGSRPGVGTRPTAGTKPAKRPDAATRTAKRQSTQPSRTRTGNSGSFGGYKRGQDTVKNSQRGQRSRTSQSSSRMSRSSMSRGGRSLGSGGRSFGGGRGRR